VCVQEDLISEPLVIFVVSTTGAGKEPRSLTPIWTSLLRSDLPSDLFEDLHFSVFGLGDTAYEKFCWPAKLLQRRLERGRRRSASARVGDIPRSVAFVASGSHPFSIDGALLPWIRALEKHLHELYPLEGQPTRVIPDGAYLPRVRLNAVKHPSSSSSKTSSALAIVSVNRRITSEDWEQDVRHIILDVDDSVQYVRLIAEGSSGSLHS
jgi:sulfite reductase alpha subunit-like flavoprotein